MTLRPSDPEEHMSDTVQIRGERAYPIYNITVRWEQDGEADPDRPHYVREGRVTNSVQPTKMYRKDPGEEEVVRTIREEWWPKYVEEKLADKNPTEPTIEIAQKYHETWCLTWFQHWTFDDGRTDREYRDSFQRYVDRHRDYQDHVSAAREWRSEEGKPTVVLMGAEDRWRWKGGPEPDSNTDPPCRCEYCQEQGVVRIGH